MSTLRRETFQRIFQERRWKSSESASGSGSTLAATAYVREILPKLYTWFEVETLLDIPCGDFHWMQHVPAPKKYIGADIVPAIIAANQARFGSESRRFIERDLVADPLPPADLVLCRDCLGHLSLSEACAALVNLKESGSTYLLSTTFPEKPTNRNIPTGAWHPLNLGAAPFHFPPPLLLLNERSYWNTSYADKSLAVWRLSDLIIPKP